MTLQRMALLGVPSYNPNTLLLVPGTGANNSTTILDTSQYGQTLTASGNAKITTAVADPFGQTNGVITFDGSNDRVTIANSNRYDSNVPFTLELFFRRVSTANAVLYYRGGGAAGWYSTNGNEQDIFIEGGVLYYAWWTGSGAGALAISAPAINTWHHFAVSYDGTTTRSFLNGTLFGSSTASRGLPITRNIIYLGDYAASNYWLNGQLSQIRFSSGALYTSNFTPPSAPFVP